MSANKSNAEDSGTTGLGSKGDFVRSLPSELSTKDVIAKAKEQGMTLTESYVYKVRQSSKKPGKRAPASKATGRSSQAKPSVASARAPKAATVSKAVKAASMVSTVTISADDPHEQAILDVMLAIGINRTRSVVESVAHLVPA